MRTLQAHVAMFATKNLKECQWPYFLTLLAKKGYKEVENAHQTTNITRFPTGMRGNLASQNHSHVRARSEPCPSHVRARSNTSKNQHLKPLLGHSKNVILLVGTVAVFSQVAPKER